jgi:cytochrome c nitrite reductase small subunit
LLNRVTFILTTLTGGLVGLGLFTFDYAEGTSYFSTDPRACANCHIMNEQYDSWTKAGHHQAATCVDCHLPNESFIEKYIAKADNGYRHSKAFTFQDFHEPIQMTQRNRDILQENCIRCHGAFVHELVSGARSPDRDSVQCVQCHRGVGHGARR